MKPISRILLQAFFIFNFSLPFLYATPHVVLSTTSVLPGETLRVEVDNVLPDTKLKAVFLGKSYPFYAVGPSALRALIGVPLGTEPVETSVAIVSSLAPKQELEGVPPVSVTVATRTYVIENIKFNRTKTELMKAEHRESVLIGKKKKYLSREQRWAGPFGSPVSGAVIAEFGLKRMRNNTIDAGFHKGLDLRAAEGTPIAAANGGTVLLASTLVAHGKTVLLDHGQGVMTIYLHMSKLLVKPGQQVKKGDTIGLVGQTGLATAPHVHWQVFVHGVAVNPQTWIDNEF